MQQLRMKSTTLANLEKLQLILKARKSVKAKELRKTLRCTLPTVYRRIEALRTLGAVILETIDAGPVVKTGPRPKAFVLVKEVPARDVE